MSISMKLRTAAAGALSVALLASGATSAFAAPGDALNPQANGSKGSFFLYDANSGELADGDAARVYTKNGSLIASASATDVLAEINPAATRPVTGSTPFDGVWRFISDKNPAAVSGGLNTWKASASDLAGGPNGGTLVADMTLENFAGVDALITSGGSFWYGVAYTINNGVTTIGAVYREINITAGSGNYTVGAVEVEAAAATDVATTTTLAALPTSVDVGQSTVLTATVSASKAVTGNVQFLEGATVLGTSALSGGIATKSVVVGSAGDHTYTAKFVENTVGSDKFLASTSAGVTVTATVPAVALPPNAPSENALNVNTANGAVATYDEVTHLATLTLDPDYDGSEVNVFVYSTPFFAGLKTFAAGKISVDVSTLPAGAHKIAVVQPAGIDMGDVIAWASFTKTDAAISPSISKVINADVANSTTPSDGEFSLTNLSGATVNLTNPTLVNGTSVVSGELGSFKVTDLRQVSKPGWTLKTDVAEFAKGTDTIAASALGIAPKTVSQAGTGATAPTLGAATTSGSADYPWNFATLEAAKFSGVSTYDADLVFTAPAGKPAGTYTSTLTLTLISN